MEEVLKISEYSTEESKWDLFKKRAPENRSPFFIHTTNDPTC
jgi:hypothetical protein